MSRRECLDDVVEEAAAKAHSHFCDMSEGASYPSQGWDGLSRQEKDIWRSVAWGVLAVLGRKLEGL